MSGWRVEVVRHGTETEPVIVFDDFAPEPERFIDDASFLAFRPMGEHYPGVRAPVPHRLLAPLLDRVAGPLAEVFGGGPAAIADAFYSLVTTPPEALTPIQRLPHFDGVEPGRLALLHYLQREPVGGTAFYRHRATGFETVTAARLPAYRAALAADLRDHVPPAAYVDATSPLFDQVASYAGAFNRAIVYRSHTLHCADLPAGTTFVADPLRGRLTVNTFLQV